MVEQQQFKVIDEQILNNEQYAKQIRVYDQKSNPDILQVLEKVFKRMADPNDAELLSLHLQYLSKTLLDLFRQANPLAKLSDDSLTYQFLNITPETWNSHQDLAGCLEKLADPM